MHSRPVPQFRFASDMQRVGRGEDPVQAGDKIPRQRLWPTLDWSQDENMSKGFGLFRRMRRFRAP
jgi:hypothetical protein